MARTTKTLRRWIVAAFIGALMVSPTVAAKGRACSRANLGKLVLNLFPPEAVARRITAARRIGACGQEKNAGALGAALVYDPEATVRMAAIRALGETGGDLATAALIAHLARANVVEERAEALNALFELGEMWPIRERLLDRDERTDLRLESLMLLEASIEPLADLEVAALTKDPAKDLRRAAAEVLKLRSQDDAKPTFSDDLSLPLTRRPPVGKLVVVCPPRAVIYVDGQDTGRRSPIAAANPLVVTVGKHSVTCDAGPDRRKTLHVTVKHGETVKIIEKLSVSRVLPAVSPKTVGSHFGKLAVLCQPQAKVLIDGRDTGRWTPVPVTIPLLLPAGKHKVTCDNGEGMYGSATVTIRANETTRWLRRLKPSRSRASAAARKVRSADVILDAGLDLDNGHLVAICLPPSRVYIDGVNTGRWTPVPASRPLSLSPGKHVITCETRKGLRKSRPVFVKPGQTVKWLYRILPEDADRYASPADATRAFGVTPGTP